MSAPSSIPTLRPMQVPPSEDGAWRRSLRAMASTIRLVLGPGATDPERSFARVRSLFEQVERECTRFDPTSDLMRANAAGGEWCTVGPYCYAALDEAARAHASSGGVFDPRVLRALHRLGYGRSLPSGDVEPAGPDIARPGVDGPWAPSFDPERRAVRIGPWPVDLGGIGKGLAVRWAAEAIEVDNPSFLIDAGGDCYTRGPAPDSGPWRIGIENPRGGTRPAAVLALTDAACVTSSVRLRHWTVAGNAVHHLIDPRTGWSGGAGLIAVTVVGSDPAESEVWSKVLFLSGADRIAAAADRDDLGALWVHQDGSVGMNAALRPLVIWQDER